MNIAWVGLLVGRNINKLRHWIWGADATNHKFMTACVTIYSKHASYSFISLGRKGRTALRWLYLYSITQHDRNLLWYSNATSALLYVAMWTEQWCPERVWSSSRIPCQCNMYIVARRASNIHRASRYAIEGMFSFCPGRLWISKIIKHP